MTLRFKTTPNKYLSQVWGMVTGHAGDAGKDQASRMNQGFTDVRQDLDGLLSLIPAGAFRSRITGAQAISAGYTVKVEYDTKEPGDVYDKDAMLFVAPKAGAWLLTASVRLFNQVDGNQAEVQLRKFNEDGVSETLYVLGRQRIGGTGLSQIVGTVPVKVKAGDRFEVYVYSSGACSIQSDPENTYFTGACVQLAVPPYKQSLRSGV